MESHPGVDPSLPTANRENGISQGLADLHPGHADACNIKTQDPADGPIGGHLHRSTHQVSPAVGRDREFSQRLHLRPDRQPPETIDEVLFPRIFIDKNHLELMNLYRDKTKLQTDLSTSPYEGKWMKPYTYILSDVSTQPLGGVQVFVNMLNCYDKIGCIWLEFDSSYKEYFEPRDPGYSFKAIGKIEKVSTYDITLVECELI